jgi:hypothetical protein
MTSIIEIPLTQNKVAIIDAEDWELVSKYKWCASKGLNTFYAYNSRQGLCMHRLILSTPRGVFTDHIDRDGLNNRRSNLRIATHSQNTINSKTSGKLLRGVRINGKRFVGQIMHNYRQIYLGTFDTEIEAHEAHVNKSIEIYGEFVSKDLIDNLVKFKMGAVTC